MEISKHLVQFPCAARGKKKRFFFFPHAQENWELSCEERKPKRISFWISPWAGAGGGSGLMGGIDGRRLLCGVEGEDMAVPRGQGMLTGHARHPAE